MVCSSEGTIKDQISCQNKTESWHQGGKETSAGETGEGPQHQQPKEERIGHCQ